MKRFWLVTGAGGFIGARVCRLLFAKSERFIGFLRPGEPEPRAGDGASWPEDAFRVVDLRDAETTSRRVAEIAPSLVLNLAAVGVNPSGGEQTVDFVDLNVRVPGLLCDAMPKDAVLVQVGSMSQYASGKGVLAEDTAGLADATLYAWSKNAAETLLGTLVARSRKAVVRARLFGVVGPGEAPHRLLPSIVAGCREGRPIELSDGLQVRDVLHVDDVAAALVHAARAPELVGKAVNVGRGEGRTVRDMAERAARRLGCEPLLRFGVLERRPGEAQQLVADVSRLRASGFTPATGFDDAIDRATDEIAASQGR